MTLLLVPVTSRSLTFELILGVGNMHKSRRTPQSRTRNWRKVHTAKGTGINIKRYFIYKQDENNGIVMILAVKWQKKGDCGKKDSRVYSCAERNRLGYGLGSWSYLLSVKIVQCL
jgi:hypothetical protein